MTPAEIEAAKMVVELDPDQEGIGEVAKANRLRWRSDLAPALLSALEEARREATDRVAAAWAEADKIGARLAAAESRAEEAERLLTAERAEATEILTQTRNSLLVELNATAARADALQKERDAAVAHDREVMARRSEDLVALAEATARADAAWRAGAEAMKACAAAVLRAGADLHAPAARMRSALYQAAKVVEILDPPKPPPPSATEVAPSQEPTT